jgi:hypothetical protein
MARIGSVASTLCAMGERGTGVAVGEKHRASGAVVAEFRMFVSRAEPDDEGYRASVFAGPSIGPEEPRLQRQEFTGSSLMDAVDPALAWAERVLRSEES